ncbi:hypothetical protein ACH3Y9_37630 [Streptomyces sp. WSLK1-5]|uniref:hypothetical protein n=1 Tax=unclassified Streptomyces TaxID=2593676 RepID=UPI003794BCC2
MRGRGAVRRLVVDGRTCLWSLRHKHRGDDVCRDVLHLVLDGVRTRIVFRAGDGRGISCCHARDGFVATGPGRVLHLNEPGTVRRLIDEVANRELLAKGGELDGWELFDAVLSRAAAATPGAPPGCPPGP